MPRGREAATAGPGFRAKLCHLVLLSQQAPWGFTCLWQLAMPCASFSRHLLEHDIQGKLVIFGNKYSTVDRFLACKYALLDVESPTR